jgi:hypothetical protein
LKPYSEKDANRNSSDISEMFASLSKAVDKFHFPGHKTTDLFCRENCNPKTELKKLGISEVNSPACEQAFKWINKFKNIKSMNESHFKFFLLYVIDLHNLHIEGKVATVANPLNPNRSMEILVSQVDNLTIDKKNESKKDDVDPIDNKNSDSLKLEECFDVDDEGALKCKYCDGKYKREGHMKNHVETKHNVKIDLVCTCGQLFDDTTRYVRHKKSCK